MIDDAETNAIAMLTQVLKELEPDAADRVLRWAADRFGATNAPVQQKLSTDPAAATTGASSDAAANRQFHDFKALYDAANPQTDPKRALVGGYWIQCVQHEPDFQAQPVNETLKELGPGITDITLAFDRLIEQSLVRQKQKTGPSKSARRILELTTAGESRVRDMIQTGSVS